MSSFTTGQATLLASAARTTTQSSGTLKNYRGKGIVVVVDVTVNAGSAGSITVAIKGVDPTSGKTYSILSSAAITSVSTTVLKVYPGLTAAANSVVSDVLPQSFSVDVTANNANPVTYSVGYFLVP